MSFGKENYTAFDGICLTDTFQLGGPYTTTEIVAAYHYMFYIQTIYSILTVAIKNARRRYDLFFIFVCF